MGYIFSLKLYFYYHWKTLFSWHKFHHSFFSPFQKCYIHNFSLFFWFRTKSAKKISNSWQKGWTSILEWRLFVKVFLCCHKYKEKEVKIGPLCQVTSRSALRFIFGPLKEMTGSGVVLGIGGLGKDCNLEGPFSSLSCRKSDADNRKRY